MELLPDNPMMVHLCLCKCDWPLAYKHYPLKQDKLAQKPVSFIASHRRTNQHWSLLLILHQTMEQNGRSPFIAMNLTVEPISIEGCSLHCFTPKNQLALKLVPHIASNNGTWNNGDAHSLQWNQSALKFISCDPEHSETNRYSIKHEQYKQYVMVWNVI